MEKWQKALNKFLEDWKDKPYVEGFLLCGSYAIGTATPKSDIDIHILLSNSIKWRERGNKIVDGHLIEYFANPIRQHKVYEKEDRRDGRFVNARMFATGKILFDRNGKLKKMKEEAKVSMKWQSRSLDKLSVEMLKYTIWDYMDGLEDVFLRKEQNFTMFYFITLEKIINAYAQFVRSEPPNMAKLSRFLNNSDFRKKYQIRGFSDSKFVSLINICLPKPSFQRIKQLADYALKKMGGFSIDGWKIRSKAD